MLQPFFGKFRFHMFLFFFFLLVFPALSFFRVKLQSEATTTPSSTSQAACTETYGTLRTAKSSTTARTRPSRRLSACPRRRRRGRNCRRRSSTVLKAVGTAPVERSRHLHVSFFIPHRWPTLESAGVCAALGKGAG